MSYVLRARVAKQINGKSMTSVGWNSAYLLVLLKGSVCASMLCIAMATGCAAIPNQATLVVESVPSGVSVTSNTGWECTTPCSQSVTRNSTLDLTYSAPNGETQYRRVEIPELKRSRTATYIGAGLGAVLLYISADVTSGLGGGIVSVLTGTSSSENILTSGEKFSVAAAGALIFGGIGYAIDNARDRQKAIRPIHTSIVMSQGQQGKQAK